MGWGLGVCRKSLRASETFQTLKGVLEDGWAGTSPPHSTDGETEALRPHSKSQQTQTRTQGLNPELSPPELLLL